jgi:protein-L-isoaspartate O-methyltransferase
MSRTARPARPVPWLLALALAAGGCAGVPGAEVPYVQTPERVVREMLRLAAVGPGDVIYDLGSGDGRIPLTAAQEFGARGVGVEIDPRLVAESQRRAARLGLGDRVRFVRQDLFETDLRPATVVTLYLSNEMNQRLRPKLLAELAPGARIVSHEFRMGDWMPAREVRVETSERTHILYLWIVPGPAATAPARP